jgi:NDP-sugar pyrophosphorylase family protein
MGKVRAYVSSAYWRDIGTPRSYLVASHDVLSSAIGRSGSEFRYIDVHHTVGISTDVTLLPPVSIAEGYQVEAGVTIGGRTSLGSGRYIEEGAMVEGSVHFEGSKGLGWARGRLSGTLSSVPERRFARIPCAPSVGARRSRRPDVPARSR